MLVATREMRFARKVGDWIIVFDYGRVAEEGLPKIVFETPQAEPTKNSPQSRRLARTAMSATTQPLWRGRAGLRTQVMPCTQARTAEIRAFASADRLPTIDRELSAM